MTAITSSVARWSARHPWRAIALWLLFVIGCFLLAGLVGTRQATTRELGVGASGRAADTMYAHGLADPAQEYVLVRGGTPAQRAAAVAAVSGRMARLSAVASVASPVSSGDARFVTVTMRGDPDTATGRVQALLDTTTAVQRAYRELTVEETGATSLQQELTAQLGTDFRHAEMVSVPVTLLILLVVFGAFIAAGVPVLLALTAVIAAIGLSAVASHAFPDNGLVAEVILMMGMAVGVDYSLFYLRREREERARGVNQMSAIEIAASTSGRSIVVSGFAVVVAMAGLYIARDVTFDAMATGCILVVAAAVIGSLTVLPAVLGKLGDRVNRPRVPLAWRLSASTSGRLWSVLLRPALRFPVLTLVLSVTALLALAYPALHLKLQSTAFQDYPRAMPATRAYTDLTSAFPDRETTFEVVVQAPASESGPVGAALTGLAARAGDPGAQLRTSADRQVHVAYVAAPYSSNSAAASTMLTRLRGALVPAAVRGLPRVTTAVGGDTAADIDYSQHIRQNLPWVMGFVLLLTFVMVMLTFGSAVMALITVLVNLLSAGAAFGVLVLVFQGTWARGLLGIDSTAVTAWVPLFLFVVLFGLSMDYHVFLINRIREGAVLGMTIRRAVEQGVTRSAGVITSAAVVMVAVFSIFASLSFIEDKQIGLGLAVAVLVDAFVVRIVILPAAIALFGKKIWGPSHREERDLRPAVQTVPFGPGVSLQSPVE